MELGALVIPVMPAEEVVDTIVAAERCGLDYCLLADETLMPDTYATLGAAARETSRVRLGPVTNGYTRHPAATAAAIATLNEISGGRAVATVVAGGSMALAPLGIARDAPLRVLDETIEVMRRLWSGEPVTWEGERFRLDGARLAAGDQQIPIWVAARGSRLLRLAGRVADAVVLEVRADLAGALALVDEGGTGAETRPARVYLDRLSHRPELGSGGASEVFVHVLMDSPDRQLRALGIDDETIAVFRSTYRTDGPSAAASHVTDDVIRRHRIVGTPEECSEVLAELAVEHQLDVFLFYVNQPGLAGNIAKMDEVRAIVESARVKR